MWMYRLLRCRVDQSVHAVLQWQRQRQPSTVRACCSAIIFSWSLSGQDHYLIFFDLLIVVKHRIRQICPIRPLSGRPPLVYMNPRLLSVQRDWFVIAGVKAPDGGPGLLGPIRNRLLSSGGRLHVEGPASLFLDASKDHPGNFGVLPHNVWKYAFLRCKLRSDNQGWLFNFQSHTLLTPFYMNIVFFFWLFVHILLENEAHQWKETW